VENPVRGSTSSGPSLDALIGSRGRHEGHQGIIVTSSAPAFAIVEFAKGSNVNLIVIGTHGRGGMAHLLLGSVAERVVRLPPCPVLTVRHPEREFVLPDLSTDRGVILSAPKDDALALRSRRRSC
jgi:nucleotide-binding universal stress UspA family protein